MTSRSLRPGHNDRALAKGMEAVVRRCQVCEWQDSVVEPEGVESDCPWCHAPTVRIATLTHAPDQAEADDALEGKNPHAAALGRMGGAKGGRARARALTAAERRQIASRAARARWGTKASKKKKRR